MPATYVATAYVLVYKYIVCSTIYIIQLSKEIILKENACFIEIK